MDQSTIRHIQQSVSYFAPELMLSATFLIVLIGELFSRRPRYFGFGIVTIAGVIGSLFLTYKLYFFPSATVFFRMIVVDDFALFFKILFGIITILVVLFSFDSKELRPYSAGEYYCLLLAVVLGMNLLAASNNLLMIWLSLELVSVPSYLLAGFLKGSKLSAEAALKFVIYGAVSTAVMLFGFSYLYGMTGAYELSAIREHLAGAHINSVVMLITIALILVGFGYK
ncbi:MAG TPA: proton-conducting transporter membrane subunit, partial [Acidobacteriota bacterium]|nr:proton-conducting transporter membrane subunit [Acidobacteriota bacterium]